MNAPRFSPWILSQKRAIRYGAIAARIVPTQTLASAPHPATRWCSGGFPGTMMPSSMIGRRLAHVQGLFIFGLHRGRCCWARRAVARQARVQPARANWPRRALAALFPR